MTSNDVIYGLHWFAVIAMLATSFSRNRSVMHPQFMFTVMFCAHFSDFLTRGFDDENISNIPLESVHKYQLLILAIVVATVYLSMLIRLPRTEVAVRSIWEGIAVTSDVIRAMWVGAWLLIGAEIVKRLVSVDWDPSEVLAQMLNPRGERDWDQLQYSGNFIYAIISIALPLSAAAFAYIFANGRGFARFTALLGFMLVLTVQVTDGSRTPVVIGLASLILFLISKQGPVLWKLLIVGAGAVGGAAIMSVMYLYRATGYVMSADQSDFAFTYHQDDSYYRAINAFYVSDYSSYSWDPLYFLYANLVNPIPRYFWPGKPLIDQAFYGEYKLDYVTTLYIGEIVAMAGPMLTLVVAILFGLAIYLLFYRSAILLQYPFGLVAYLLVALYIHMILRSSQNLAQFIYLPAFGVLMVHVLRRWQGATVASQKALAREKDAF